LAMASSNPVGEWAVISMTFATDMGLLSSGTRT
jgi:hypothetical protein